MTDAAAVEREVRELLGSLEAWRVDSLPPQAGAGLHKGSGEAASRISAIRARLIALGARFHLGPRGYELDALGPPPGLEGPATDHDGPVTP